MAATEQTVAAIDQLLDHVATYPDYEIIYRASDMILAAHSDTGLSNDSKARSRAGADIFLSEDKPTPKQNGAVLAISQIIKLAMSLAAEAELGAMYITAKEMVPVCQTLIEMGWKQHQSPIQTDNSRLTGVVKKPSSNEKENHGLACPLATVPRIARPISILLGPRSPQLERLLHKSPYPNLPYNSPTTFPGYVNIFKR